MNANRSGSLAAQGKFAEAEASARDAVATFDRLGHTGQERLKALRRLGYSLAAQGKDDAAAAAYDRWRKAVRGYLSQADGFVGPAQLAFLTTHRPDEAVALALRHPAAAAAAFEWAINHKGAAIESLARRGALERDLADDPAGRLRFDALTEVRRELGKAGVAALAGPPAAAARQEIARLVEREKTLTEQIGEVTSRAADPARWVAHADVAGRFPADVAVVEYFRLVPPAFRAGDAAGGRPPRYVAWVVHRGQAPRMHDLGPAAPIDDAVAKARSLMQRAAADIVDRGEV